MKPKILDKAVMTKGELLKEIEVECDCNEYLLQAFETIKELDKKNLLENYFDESVDSIVRAEFDYLYDIGEESFCETFDFVMSEIGHTLPLVIVANLLDKDEISDAELVKVLHNDKLLDVEGENMGDLTLATIADFSALVDELKVA